jgi:hypothetical protein
VPQFGVRIRVKAWHGAAEEKIRFTSSILPKWARRTKSVDALLPILYLRGAFWLMPMAWRRTAVRRWCRRDRSVLCITDQMGEAELVRVGAHCAGGRSDSHTFGRAPARKSVGTHLPRVGAIT